MTSSIPTPLDYADTHQLYNVLEDLVGDIISAQPENLFAFIEMWGRMKKGVPIGKKTTMKQSSSRNDDLKNTTNVNDVSLRSFQLLDNSVRSENHNNTNKVTRGRTPSFVSFASDDEDDEDAKERQDSRATSPSQWGLDDEN
eukprot:PhF_6_TR7505/c0_g1_i1/m.11125